jgi:hypothetical protein
MVATGPVEPAEPVGDLLCCRAGSFSFAAGRLRIGGSRGTLWISLAGMVERIVTVMASTKCG